MKLSKWLFVTTLLLSAALSLSGCMNTGNEAQVAPSATAMLPGNGGVEDNAGQNGQMAQDGTGAATLFDWANNAAQVETAINQISEISDSRVVVAGTTALVAVRYTQAYQGETTQRIREMIAGVVREADPSIQTVAVTAQEEDVTKVYEISDKIRAGATADSLAEEINTIVRNPTTLR